ncbi:PQQ-dependent sugar dehydrogenase [bacterium]|nr:PQQ-dependent sugar dehydrogenase [bacterium]
MKLARSLNQYAGRLGGLLLLLAISLFPTVSDAITLPSGFQEQTAFQGLSNPTVVRFAPDGRIFVAEKVGRIKIFNGLSDTTPDVLVDLSVNVHNYWDRGLLGMAIDPQFPAKPYIYVLYTYDFDPNDTDGPPPPWGDACPTPPGPTADGCVVNGRLSKLEVAPNNTLVGSEQVLLENFWCQQYPSHSLGTLQFGPEGALYASAGDGASFTFVDYGQDGNPLNPCGDPPSGIGGMQTIPTAEGGALRSQDLQTSGDAVTFDGAILRIDPDTGAAWPDNPLIGGDPADDRIIAYGLRNPFRFTTRPGTSELWIGDVGWNTFEEVNRLQNPLVVTNFGWPCYEGSGAQGGYSPLNICQNLYSAGTATAPFYAYNHNSDVTPGGDGCRPNPNGTGTSSSIAGLAFHMTGTFPAQYDGAFFFADYSRDCIYIMYAGAGGVPDLSTRTAFGVDASNPVMLETGPGGDLFYADFDGGKIMRIQYTASNNPPTAAIQANPTFGDAPLFVQFDGSNSSDPDPGATLFYNWDLDGDGQYDDSTIVNPVYTYPDTGSSYQVTVGLKVTDDDGGSDTESIVITIGNTPPTANISQPLPSLTWKVGDVISFQGSGSDIQDGIMAPSSMQWDVIMHHCPGGTPDCHTHIIQSFVGVDQGTFTAPDHEWYSFLEFRLTVTDSGGLTDQQSVLIDPQVVTISYDSVPQGLQIDVGGVSETTPFDRFAIIGSLNTITALSPQDFSSEKYYWVSWSDSGAISHEILAGETPVSYTATFALCVSTDTTCDGVDDDCDGTPDDDYVSQNTSCGIGACLASGATSCVNGQEEDSCTPGNPAPNDATCDGIDDDCDGTNDEDYISVITSCGVGACSAQGVTSCVNGQVQDSCSPGNPAPNDATCDGIDDDCDGTNDEDYISVITSCGIGACSAEGATSCVNGQEEDSCTPGNPAPNDATCDGIDDDCDGTNDEDYISVITSCGIGACSAQGATSCVNGQEQDSCLPGDPADDDATCNGIDDDCDGTTDEDVPPVSISPPSQNFDAFGGQGSITVTVPPGACPWTAESQDTWITILSGGSGTTDGVVLYEVLSNPDQDQRSGTIKVNEQIFTVNQDGVHTSVIFFDDFEDQDASDWKQVRPSWSVVNGDLKGTSTKLAYITSPDFGGCSNCTFETDITLETANARASFLAWHVDKKNMIEMRLLADKNKVDLRYKSAGRIVQRKKLKQQLALNQSYRLRLTYSNSKVQAYLDQVLVLELNVQNTPLGNAGFRVKSAGGDVSAHAGQILIY